ncbi:hypothetical protein SSX86_015177 [Deinandra increscens subsp. villosa]|uniref:Remorin C-terminal domain-containing protein n=1 Tax=Deinandra increscens subsp. villosa TaxID=3103831 RepID=A0AAP0GY03_9ASTR
MPNYDQRFENHHGDEDMSVTNSTLVLAGSPVAASTIDHNEGASNWGLGVHPSLSPTRRDGGGSDVGRGGGGEVVVSTRSFKKEEVESKISAWKNAKIAEINNRFKCEDTIINGWEAEQAQRSTLRMKKVERKLEEKRVRAMEKMENEIAKAHRKAEERRASEEAKRGTKIARVLEVANLMKAMGRAPVKSSFF